jgi:hypothetical protein
MKIYDRDGIERSASWLAANYGEPIIHPAGPGLGWRIAEIREIKDPEVRIAGIRATNTLIVKALLADGRPAPDLPVAWYWPDAPEDPGSAPANGLPAEIRPGRAVHGPTNINGDVGFGMGRGAYYSPPAIGPHATWIYGANSDVILGLGMLAGTAHQHIDVTFQLSNEEPSPAPPEPADSWVLLFQRLDAIIAILLAGND